MYFRSDFLSILQKETIHVYGVHGETYSVPLPCKARSIWPLPEVNIYRFPSCSPPNYDRFPTTHKKLENKIFINI